MWIRNQRQNFENITHSSEYLELVSQSGLPYALYLRGFSREGTYLREEAENGFSNPNFRSPVTGRFLEILLFRACKPEKELVGLANVSYQNHPGGIVWLNPGDKDWQSEIHKLMEDAKQIFLYINNWTSGVKEEISIINKNYLCQKTIVLISPELKRHNAEIQLTLDESTDQWVVILDVPDKTISWIIIILGLLFAMIGIITDWGIMFFISIGIFMGNGIMNEVRIYSLVRKIKRHMAS